MMKLALLTLHFFGNTFCVGKERGKKRVITLLFIFLETQLELSISSPQYENDYKSVF